LTLASLSNAAEGRLQSGGRAATSSLFGELCGAASALMLACHSSGINAPGRLVGTYLIANMACIDALHKLRFGNLASGTMPKESALAEAAEVSHACHHLEQLRLCGNVLWSSHPAQEFLRMTCGLRVLLSNCYADHHLPMLRENGIFALRNATVDNPANQVAAKQLLEERKTAQAGASGYAQAPMWSPAEELGI